MQVDEIVANTTVTGSILIVSGEASGDEHGALLATALRKQAPQVELFGMGGSACRAAGVQTVIDSESHASVMGVTELFGKIQSLRKAFKQILQEVDKRRPIAAVVIDFPDFNLRLARELKKRGIDVVYFITPQVWAWRQGRVKAIKRDFRKALPIFPFEEAFFHKNGVDAEYIGHPFLDRPPVSRSRSEILRGLNLDPASPVLALLPGSRIGELDRLLLPMVEAYKNLVASRPGLQAVLPVAASLSYEDVKSRVEAISGISELPLRVTKGEAREVLAAANLAVVASGTATVEAALAGVPFVAVYKLSSTTFRIARWLVKGVRHFAMVNLIAGKKVVPELLQDEVTGSRICQELERIFGCPEYAQSIRDGLQLVCSRLEAGRPQGVSSSERAATLVLEVATGEANRPRKSWRNPRREPKRRQAGGIV